MKKSLSKKTRKVIEEGVEEFMRRPSLRDLMIKKMSAK